MCFLIRNLGLEESVTTNVRAIILGIDPKFRLSTRRSNSKVLEMIYFKMFQDQNLFI